MRNKIINYIRAGYPGLYLVSPEEQRVEAEMKHIAQELQYNLVFWSVVAHVLVLPELLRAGECGFEEGRLPVPAQGAFLGDLGCPAAPRDLDLAGNEFGSPVQLDPLLR